MSTHVKTQKSPSFTDRVFNNLLSLAPSPLPPVDSVHPLDPLTRGEVLAVGKACKAYASSKMGLNKLRFNSITLQEPPKAALVAYNLSPEKTILPRRAEAVIQTLVGSKIVEATLELTGSTPAVMAWTVVEGVQPPVTIQDTVEAEQICKADASLQRLLRERYGVKDMSLVAFDPWYYGDRFASKESKYSDAGRLIQCFTYLRVNNPSDNHYAHPLDLVVLIDMNRAKVLDLHMDHTPPAVPQLAYNFAMPMVVEERGIRTGLKPLNVVQPEGPSFSVDGNQVTWQKWNIRVAFNHREGLVLHNVGYEDKGRVRPVLHRASIVEVIVPYADPRPPFHKKCAFDVLDYGLGFSCSSLDLGCDCLGHIHYFDAVLNDCNGEPLVIPKAVCMHEEDAGLLWKHVEYREGRNDTRRSRRLVLSFVATIANYEYGFFWYFYQDGTIQHEVKLTGCLSTNLLSPGEGPYPTHGTLMSPGLNAQHHQHFFCARMDMAVDDPQGGQGLTVTEVNCETQPLGEDNPYGTGFVAIERELASEQSAIRCVDPYKSRVWKIKNPNSLHPVTGYPVAWKLMPAASPPMYAHPTSEHQQRGAFATRHLWVTPHADDEMWPAGKYPLKVGDNDGIVRWTNLDRTVKGSDVVVWHSFGVTHLPRVEDFPVMPVETVGFHLKPFNFFDANPGLDIKHEPNAASREHACSACSTSISKL